MPWDQAREVTFECEPGTLQQHKLETLKEIGVTRLSLGVENFEPTRSSNPTAGRTSRPRSTAPTIGPASAASTRSTSISSPAWSARRGTTGATASARRSRSSPESVTIYQMELPFNTVFSKEMRNRDRDQDRVDMSAGSLPTTNGPRSRGLADQAGVGRLRIRRVGRSRVSRSSAYTMVTRRREA